MLKCTFLLFALATLFVGCKETAEEPMEYQNWAARNETAFIDTLRNANALIAKARQQWGDNWEQHCQWRTFRTYTLTTAAQATWKDSIAVRILHSGNGGATPLSTDTVRINYTGRLISTSQRPEGLLFDHSPLITSLVTGYRPEVAKPVKFGVNNQVDGFTTALQQMHIDDRWRVFIPSSLGYGSRIVKVIPAHSTLIFDIHLRDYWRAGTHPLPWQ